MPRLSLYGTTYNCGSTVAGTVESLLTAIPGFHAQCELVVVDNYSDDGTWETLERLAHDIDNVTLLRRSSSRGEGRNIALEHSTGRFVSPIDFDNIYKPELGQILNLAMESLLDDRTIVNFAMTRSAAVGIGGWRDLNAGEDFEFTARAISSGLRVFKVPAPMATASWTAIRRTGLREWRYRRSGVQMTRRMARWLLDQTRGWGITRPKQLKTFSYAERIAGAFGIVMAKTLDQPIFNYSGGSLHNADFVNLHSRFLSPAVFNIPESSWVTLLGRSISPQILSIKLAELAGLGLSDCVVGPGGERIVFSPKADPSLVQNLSGLWLRKGRL